ncbi:MAG: ribbon-helix-helix domain-containing protein [Armatimonadota bacterium]
MIRMQVQLTEEQSSALKQIAQREGISMAEAIRRSLDRYFDDRYLPDREDLKKRALSAAGSIHSDLTDLSTRHDDHLDEIYSSSLNSEKE